MRRQDDSLSQRRAMEQMAGCFTRSTGVSVLLLPRDQEPYTPEEQAALPCQLCMRLSALGMNPKNCLSLHKSSARQSERFGGRYIYFCPLGLAHFVSPVFLEGRAELYLEAGPVLITEPEDLLAELELGERREELLPEFSALLQGIPRRSPAALDALSHLLFAVAAHLGDSSRQLLAIEQRQAQQRSLGEEIYRLKQQEPASFPQEKEDALLQSMEEGDRNSSQRILNELLGYLFFSSGGDLDELRGRAAELLFTMASAAKRAGVARESLTQSNRVHYRQIDACGGFEPLMQAMLDAMNDYCALAAELRSQSYRDTVTLVLPYIKQRLSERLTLADAAAYAGYSPVYFGRIFKEAMGTGFSAYVTALRVRRGAALLCDRSRSILDVAQACGFEDQSYFTKVFKKSIGVSPAQYREQNRRPDPRRRQRREHDL